MDAEDAMGKHRAGAVDKSLRFADKALEHYQAGLQLFPDDGDLAYNRARLELEVATHPLFVKHITDVPQKLHNSLASHRVALTLLPDNADLLFNTAQALTMLAEIGSEDESESTSTILKYLVGHGIINTALERYSSARYTDIFQVEALDCQARCFRLQVNHFTESRQMMSQIDSDQSNEEDDDGGAKVDSSITTAFEESNIDQTWVSVVEPVTAETLLDTILAQLATLTTLCSFLTNNPASSHELLKSIETYSSQVNDTALPDLLKNEADLSTEGHVHDIMLAQINFKLNHTDLLFITGHIGIEAYQQALEVVHVKLPELKFSDVHIAFAKGLLTFSNSIGMASQIKDVEIRWKALSQALKILAGAATLPDVKESPDNLATTHLLRGDVSLMLKGLGDEPFSHPQALSNSAQLLKNAQTYYTNAYKLATVELKDICDFRRSIAAGLYLSSEAKAIESQHKTSQDASDVGPAKIQISPSPKNPSWYLKQIQVCRKEQISEYQLLIMNKDMVEEGLIHESTAAGIAASM